MVLKSRFSELYHNDTIKSRKKRNMTEFYGKEANVSNLYA